MAGGAVILLKNYPGVETARSCAASMRPTAGWPSPAARGALGIRPATPDRHAPDVSAVAIDRRLREVEDAG